MSLFKKFSLASVIAFSLIGSGAIAQSVPPLTKVIITSVYSSNQGAETISQYQTATVQDHGGAQVRITVREIGYAKSVHTVKLNGTIVSNTVISSTRLCGTASAPTTTCNTGDIIIGFDKVFQIDGQSGGAFSVSAQNASTPFNWITDTLNIL